MYPFKCIYGQLNKLSNVINNILNENNDINTIDHVYFLVYIYAYLN